MSMESQLELPSDVAAVRIRDAQPDDRDFILGLVPELLAFDSPPVWRGVGGMTAVDVRVIGEALESRPRGASVLIAEDERGLRMGFIHLCEEQDYYGGVCGHVGDVVVSPAARGRGVGLAVDYHSIGRGGSVAGKDTFSQSRYSVDSSAVNLLLISRLQTNKAVSLLMVNWNIWRKGNNLRAY